MHHPRVLLLKGTIPIVAIFLILTFLYFYYNYIDSQDGSKMCQGACVLWAKAALAACFPLLYGCLPILLKVWYGSF